MPHGKLGRFRVATTGGRSISQDDFLGRPALFYGWASWDPSREALGKVEALHRKHGDRATIASVAFDVEGPGRAMKYYAAARCTHLPLVDATFTLRRLWGKTSLPFWFVIDADGCIQAEGDALSPEAGKALGRPARHAKAKAAPSKRRFEKAEFLLQTAGTFLSRSRTEDAARCLSDAEAFDPTCAMYRPQRLALLQPNRFYSGAIDLKWMKAQP